MTEELNKLENQDYTPGAESGTDDGSNTKPEPNDQDGANKPNRLERIKIKAKANRRKILISGGAGIGILGGGMFMGSILQGPFQFIQIGQFAQGNLEPNEVMVDSRLSQGYRFNRAINNIDNSHLYRLGWTGRKLWGENGRATQYLANRGIRPVYENSVLVDLVDPNGQSIRRGDQTFRDIESGDTAASRRTANLQRRNFVRSVAWQNGGVSKAAIAIGSRSFFKVSGIDLRPLGNFKYDRSKSFFENLQLKNEQENAAARGETSPLDFTGAEPDPDADGNGDVTQAESDAADAAKAQADAQADQVKNIDVDEIRNAPNTNANNSPSATLKGKLRAGAGVGLAVSVACLARELSSASDEAQHAQAYMVLMRIAGRFMAIGSQIQAGEAGPDMLDELGLLATHLYDKESGLDWSAAKSVGAVEGKSEAELENRPDMFASGQVGTKAAQNDLKKSLDSIGSFTPGPICSAFNSTAAQVAFALVDPVGEAAEAAIMHVLTELFLDDVLRMISGEPVDFSSLFGPDTGNAITHGGFFLGRETRRQLAGTEITPAQSTQWRRFIAEQNELDAKEKGFGYRYFAIDNPKSLVSSFARSFPTSLKQVASSLGDVTNNFKSVFGWASAPFARVNAIDTDNYDFGVPDIGIPLDTLFDETYENPYQNTDLLHQQIQQNPNFDDINDLHEEFAKECFNMDITEGSGENPSLTIVPMTGLDDGGTPYYEMTNKCNRNDVFFNRYRFYVLDLMANESMNCYLGDANSCEVLGINSAPSNSGGDSTNTPSYLSCPDLSTTLSVQGFKYYLLPDLPDGINVRGGSNPDDYSYGVREIVCAVNTVAEKFRDKYGAGAYTQTMDLNGSGHWYHANGTDVDTYAFLANGQSAATNVSAQSQEATIELGKMWIDTGLVDTIIWCDPGSTPQPTGDMSNQTIGNGPAMDALREYGRGKGKNTTGDVLVFCWSSHYDHFHIRIDRSLKGPCHMPLPPRVGTSAKNCDNYVESS